MTAALDRLLAKPGITALTPETVEAYIATGTVALFFTGNTTRYPEINDLATILPELMSEFPAQFRVGIIDPDAHRPLAARYKVTIRPSLVFTQNGAVLGSIPRLRDWSTYVTEIATLLSQAPPC
jgi:hydrogenase-1 operon protein HyaE